MDGESPPIPPLTLLDVELIMRESCACPAPLEET
jgi:hypothetical protein